jgi:hypothetical protein
MTRKVLPGALSFKLQLPPRPGLQVAGPGLTRTRRDHDARELEFKDLLLASVRFTGSRSGSRCSGPRLGEIIGDSSFTDLSIG